MEIINRKHEDLRLSRRTKSMPYMSIPNSKEILFSVYATSLFGLEKGLFVHFINDDDQWMFYVSDDSDGFQLKFRPKKNHALLFNAHLVKLFTTRTKRSIGDKFYLELMEAKFKGSQLIKIHTDSPLMLHSEFGTKRKGKKGAKSQMFVQVAK